MGLRPRRSRWRRATAQRHAESTAASAVIVPAFDGCGLADLVAEDLQSRRLLRRLGVANLLGVDQVELARETEQPLLIFDSALSWLRGHTLGAVIVDWSAAGYELEGVARDPMPSLDRAPAARCDTALLAAPGHRNTGKKMPHAA